MTRKPTGPACGNNPNYPLTDGDRQAVEKFKAHLSARAERRRRYGDVLRRWGLLDEVNNPQDTEEFFVTDLLAIADAEQQPAAVPSAPADRAAVLREAADAMDTHCEQYGVLGVGDRLRRMADEAQQGGQP